MSRRGNGAAGGGATGRPGSAPGERSWEVGLEASSRRKRACSSTGDREISSSPAAPSHSPSQSSIKTTSSVQSSRIFDDGEMLQGFEDDPSAPAHSASEHEAQAVHQQLVASQRMLSEGQQLREDLCRELEASKIAEVGATQDLELLEDEVNVLRLELGAIKEDASRLTEENEQLRHWYGSCELERDEAISRLGEVLRTLRSEQQASLLQQIHLEEATKTTDALNTEVRELRSENADLRARQADYQPESSNACGVEAAASCEETARELAECSMQLCESMEREKALGSLMRKLQSNLQHKNGLLATIQEDLNQTMRSLAARDIALQVKEADLKECQQQLQAERKGMGMLQDELLARTVQLKDAKVLELAKTERLRSAEDQVAQLTLIKKDLMAEFVQMQQDFQETTTIAEAIKVDQDRANREHDDLKQNFERCQQQLLQSRAEVIRQKLQLEMSSSENDRLSCEVEKQKNIVNVLRQEELRLRMEAGADDKVRKLEREINDLKMTIKKQRLEQTDETGMVCHRVTETASREHASSILTVGNEMHRAMLLPQESNQPGEASSSVMDAQPPQMVPAVLIRKQIKRVDRARPPSSRPETWESAETPRVMPASIILDLQANGSEDSDNGSGNSEAVGAPTPDPLLVNAGEEIFGISPRRQLHLDQQISGGIEASSRLIPQYHQSEVLHSSANENHSMVPMAREATR